MLRAASCNHAGYEKACYIACEWLAARTFKSAEQYSKVVPTAVWNKDSLVLSKVASLNPTLLESLLEKLQQAQAMQPSRTANDGEK